MSLSCREYRPEGEPVGILLVIHGLGEHQGRYVSFAGFLAENGFVAADGTPSKEPPADCAEIIGRMEAVMYDAFYGERYII